MHGDHEYAEIDDITAPQTYEALQKDRQNDTSVSTEYEVMNILLLMDYLLSFSIMKECNNKT